jgi:hypothetical protein
MTTGRMPVAGLSLIARHTSYPLISGIMTSSSTRSGRSVSTFSSASAPEAAVATAYPVTARRSARSLTFWGRSSTTRILA